MRPGKLNQRQQGSTLLVGMIMLVVLTLLVVSGFKMGRSNLMIVGNMQHRTEAIAAAQAATEQALASAKLFTDSANLLAGSSQTCGATKICVDVNGDGTNDIEVDVTVTRCVSTPPVKAEQLDFSNAQDQLCLSGTQQSFGVEGAVTGDSLCTDETSEIQAAAVDDVTGAEVTVVQGVSVRQSSAEVATNCP